MTRHLTGNQSFTSRQPAPADGLDGQLGGANAADLAESSFTANLVVVGGPNDGVLFPIPRGGLTLGRLPENDVVIDDPWVSRRHAEIISTQDSYILRDLASSNGTFLTDRLIDASDYGLQDGDHIRLGQADILLVFRFSGAATLKMAPRTGGEMSQVPDVSQASQRPRIAVRRDSRSPASASDTSGPDGVTGRGERECGEAPVKCEIRLNVDAGGDVRLMYQFVHELRQEPEFNVLRISGAPRQHLNVWLSLAERMPLEPLLSNIKFVSEVSLVPDPPTGGGVAETVFDIRLAI